MRFLFNSHAHGQTGGLESTGVDKSRKRMKLSSTLIEILSMFNTDVSFRESRKVHEYWPSRESESFNSHQLMIVRPQIKVTVCNQFNLPPSPLKTLHLLFRSRSKQQY